MKRDLEGRVIVITGASSGIGRATALELASRGAVLVLASRDAVALDQVVRECEDAGGRAVAAPADVTIEEEVEAIGRLALARFGRIDVWINDAAVALFATFETAPSDVYRRVIETNLFGSIHGARVALRQFKRQGRGILINIDSFTAGAPQPYTSAYVASKYAIRGWSACLRMELSLEQQDQIHVCNVMPAAIDTPLFQHAANYTGRAVKALDPVYRPETVAQAIGKLILKPRAEVVVGRAGKPILAHAHMTPRLYEKAAARHFDRNHFQDRPAVPTEGNVMRTSGLKSVEGGWRKRGTLTAKAHKGAIPAAVAVIAAALLWGGLGGLRARRSTGTDRPPTS